MSVLRAAGLAANEGRRVSLGRIRGRPAASGGYVVEIVGGGEVRRAELSPREAVIVAVQILASQGIAVELDASRFRA